MFSKDGIVLRPVKEDDINYFLKWFNDPAIMRNVRRYLPMTEMFEREWIANLGKKENENVVFVIDLLTPNKLFTIGICGLHQINWHDQCAEFGITIGDKDMHRKGHGFTAASLLINYAFQQLNLRRIDSAAYDFNEPSIRLHHKLGFKEEGLRRKAIYVDGDFHDVIVFGLLREEFNRLTA